MQGVCNVHLICDHAIHKCMHKCMQFMHISYVYTCSLYKCRSSGLDPGLEPETESGLRHHLGHQFQAVMRLS